MIARQSSPEGHPYSSETRGLLGVAMAVFVITVVIGILNGLDMVEFDRNTLLTHVHAGTIGWISLSVLTATLWLFGERPVSGAGSVRALAWFAGVSVPVYVLAFLTGNFAFRAIAGLAVLAAIAWWLWWTITAARSRPLTTPRLAIVAGIVTLTYGAVVGVILQVQFATGTTVLGALEGIGAHVTAMAFSYLVLVGMGIVEWRLRPEGPLTAAGVVQVGALFLGGLVLSIGSLVGALAVAGGLNLLGELIGVSIFIGRMARPVLRVPWLQAGPLRHFGIAAVFVVVDVVVLAYLLYSVLTGAYGDPASPDLADIPIWLIFALDHAIFVGVMTNVILGLLWLATFRPDRRPAWADEVIFWGMNLGLVGFVAGLALDSAELKRLFSPIMGISILIGLALMALRLREVGLNGASADTGAELA